MGINGNVIRDRLSTTMQRALAAIEESGGEAHPERGGWWKGKDGERLKITTDDWRHTSTIGTNTVIALYRRGYLQPMEQGGNHVHRAYRISDEWAASDPA